MKILLREMKQSLAYPILTRKFEGSRSFSSLEIFDYIIYTFTHFSMVYKNVKNSDARKKSCKKERKKYYVQVTTVGRLVVSARVYDPPTLQTIYNLTHHHVHTTCCDQICNAAHFCTYGQSSLTLLPI